MKNAAFIALLSIALAACGGGGQDELAASESALPVLAQAKKERADTALVAQPASVVNTTIAGDQSLRSIGVVADGGYTVAWISGQTLYMQRYDSAGQNAGGETVVQLNIAVGDNTEFVTINSSVAVLTDGGVVVAYPVIRNFPQPNGTVLTESGIYMQRFDPGGVQVLAETQLASRLQLVHYRSSFFGEPKTLALADGGYVLGWTDFTPSAVVGVRNTFYNQRFDSQNQRVGASMVIGEAGTVGSSYRFTADAHGGYTLYSFQIDPNNYPRDLVTVNHYEASQMSRQIVAPRAGGAVLLPLESGSYVLFATNSVGEAYSQILDSGGNPVAEPSPISSPPISAEEMADGSYVVFWASGGGVAVQRFDSGGAPMGDVQAIQTHGGGARAVALADGGFAAAWSAAGSAGDVDVYTQRFVEQADNQRKACLTGARGMHGRERKAFMEACMR
jgi:hypothetical protein